jgi:hypothetical protein
MLWKGWEHSGRVQAEETERERGKTCGILQREEFGGSIYPLCNTNDEDTHGRCRGTEVDYIQVR